MSEIKLNLGCGQTGYEGWVNIDNSPSVILSKFPLLRTFFWRAGVLSKYSYESVWPKNAIWKDLTKKLSYATDSVDKIYSSHVLEHMQKEQGEFLLKECYRILKKQGVMRLAVPDLEFCCRRYLQKISSSEPVGREPHDELIFNMYGAYLNKKRYGAHHRYMYDWPTLREILMALGFSKIARQPYKAGIDQELYSLDNRPEDSLHIDLIK